MAKEYLTIKEASEITGKSLVTIRRLVKKLKEPDIKKEKINTGYIWLISKEYLTTHLAVQLTVHFTDKKAKSTTIQEQIQTDKEPYQNEHVDSQLTNFIEFLKEQLREKDQQITELNNRLKEANILHMQLQNKFLETKQITDKKPNIFARLFNKTKE